MDPSDRRLSPIHSAARLTHPENFGGPEVSAHRKLRLKYPRGCVVAVWYRGPRSEDSKKKSPESARSSASIQGQGKLSIGLFTYHGPYGRSLLSFGGLRHPPREQCFFF